MLFRKKDVKGDLDDELRFHLEKEIESNIARGMNADDARRQALIAFGGVQQTKESVRQVRWTHFAEVLVQDSRYAWRMLRKSPGFTTVAVLTLALGIGMNTAIFSIVNDLLFRALHASRPNELVVLRWHARSQPEVQGFGTYGDCIESFDDVNPSSCSFSLPFFNAARAQTAAFASLAASAGPPGLLVLSTDGPAKPVDVVQSVSGEYFQVLGINAAMGRTLGPADDSSTAPPALMLSYDYWQSAFGGDPSIVGKTVRLNRVLFAVVGVADRGFAGLTPGSHVDIWLPFSARSRLQPEFARGEQDAANWWVVIVGRLKPEFPLTQAEAGLNVLFRNQTLHGENPAFKTADQPGIDIVPARQALQARGARALPPLKVLMLASGLVLLIACANIAGLLLARGNAREKELAVRLALGARRGRLLRQLLTESLLLASMGGSLGIGLAYWTARLLASWAAKYGPRFTPEIDGHVLAFAAVVSILTGLLFGLVPALRSLHPELIPALSALGNGRSARRSRWRWFGLGHSLVVAQVALAMVALVCAGLLVHTVSNLRSVDPGFDIHNVLLFGVNGPSAGYKAARAESLYRELREKFSALPGVTSASYSADSLLSGGLMTGRVHLPEKPDSENERSDWCSVGPGFLATMRLPLLAGRDFVDADFRIARENAAAGAAAEKLRQGNLKGGTSVRAVPLPVIVNETFVRKFRPDASPLGQRLEEALPSDPRELRGPGWEIVGVVRDAKYDSLRRAINPTMYVPHSGGYAVFELRTAVDPNQLVPAVREVTYHADNDLALFDVMTQSERVDQTLFIERRIAQLSSFFGLLALVLASGGIYGLLSFEVSRRTREIGIRMAIGAQWQDVVRLVVRQGMLVTVTGAVIGGGASFAAKKLLSAILYGVKPGDPATLVTVAVILLVVALASCYLPARRATRVDPLVALRYE